METISDHTKTGKEGEGAASAYLQAKEYAILHTNWRWHHYEIDIVAAKEDEIIIVEVKTRSSSYLGEPEEAVNKGKIKRLVTAANAYVRFFRIDLPVRFDIITLIRKEDGGFTIEHIEDAFYAPLK